MRKLLMLAMFALVLVSCASTTPLMVAEQSLSSALDVTGTLVAIDYEQAAPCRQQGVAVSATCSVFEKKFPGAHKIANDIRTLFPPVLRAANSAIGVYRQAKVLQVALASSSTATPEQKAQADAAVTAALGKMNETVAKCAQYVVEARSVINGWQKGMGK